MFSNLLGTKSCHLGKAYPITRRQTLDSSKLKEFADDNFKFEENGRKLSKQVENTVGKVEIYLFLLTHSVFYPFGELSAVFINFVICKLFQFGRI